MMSLRRLLSILPLIFAWPLTLPAQANSPFEGKWVFNAEKSVFSPSPLPRSETLTFANGTVTVEGVNPQASPSCFPGRHCRARQFPSPEVVRN